MLNRNSYPKLIFVSFLFILGIFLFTKGFFLSRFELEQKNNINNFKSSKKVILFFLDALRFDFLSKNHTESYHGHLPYVQKLMDDFPNQTLLYHFISDPPTTTSQRLKGLTCGSLPTFIDAGKNFDSDRIRADNWVHQLHVNNKKMVVLGDDTWKNLFPMNMFARSRLYPAFNVHDLDTVDNGILKYFEKEIEGDQMILKDLYKEDTEFGESYNYDPFNIIVGHFLGVDHAGHRYGVFHHKMNEKLKQMNQVIERVVQRMDNDTVFILMSDHGMTDSGNHGGGSHIEVDSVLFLHSKGNQFPKQKNDIIPQIDFVPTLSYLLGIPIPFGSMGKIIPEIIKGINTSDKHYLEVLKMNSEQVFDYIQEYTKYDSSFNQLSSLNNEYKRILQSQDKDEIIQGCTKYLNDISIFCRRMWAQFDLNLMILGFGIFTLGILILLTTLEWRLFQEDDWISFSFLLIYSLSLLSNSFIVYEDRVVIFFLVSLFIKIFYSQNLSYKPLIIFTCIHLSKMNIQYRSHGTHIMESLRFSFNSIEILLSLIGLFIIFGYSYKGKTKISYQFFSFFSLCSTYVMWYFREFKDTNLVMIPQVIYLISILFIMYLVYYERYEPFLYINIYYILNLVIILIKGYEYIFIILIMNIQVFSVISFNSFRTSFRYIMLWSLISSQYFFALGQQNTFNTINWNAAFIGFDQVTPLSSILIYMNIFSSLIVLTLLFPFISLDFESFILIRGLPTCVTIFFVMIQREHLMLWSIFAPKFIFDVIGFGLFLVLIIFVKGLSLGVNEVNVEKKVK